ncbi:bacterial regulatory helix-turn-helix, lysR family protein [Janthinobacterium agaricidamnosum NBRC 102515 = DSM 9628]|uniref:Bacterial regulatory helix-turn-helix, lysR family protein n=1 Tax=Janthinobacterium agaricidamnosum NBRC 102515 = DSM 9628 TaxID=1349767 RepID=W0V6I6_9BURK|nr:bacterial regulatory helix-turn-helix, lysR family protein [Janthinobacterium agaricidamnosum NBRC 102515 = DSM 9628]
MLDAMSMDQLRTFIAAADEGSFSAAGRKLGRAQSVVSQTLANLEQQIGLALFCRKGRYPALTEAGKALLSDARAAASAGVICRAIWWPTTWSAARWCNSTSKRIPVSARRFRCMRFTARMRRRGRRGAGLSSN